MTAILVTYVLVAGRAEDGSGVAHKDPSTGRQRINFGGHRTMGTSRWIALRVLLVTAVVTAGQLCMLTKYAFRPLVSSPLQQEFMFLLPLLCWPNCNLTLIQTAETKSLREWNNTVQEIILHPWKFRPGNLTFPLPMSVFHSIYSLMSPLRDAVRSQVH